MFAQKSGIIVQYSSLKDKKSEKKKVRLEVGTHQECQSNWNRDMNILPWNWSFLNYSRNTNVPFVAILKVSF